MFRNLTELYRYRALIWALVGRHLATRYRGSVLGFVWSFLNPLCLMAVYTVVFKYYMRSNVVEHYSLFLFCGLLPWQWVASSAVEGTSSLVSSGHLITKSMFPAHILPVVAVITNLVHFVLALPLLVLFLWLGGVGLNLSILALPLIVILQTVFLAGATLASAALNVYYRDVQHLVANLLTVLFFLCPIVYPASVVPMKYRATIELNPLAVLTVSYQKLMLDGVLPSMIEFVTLLLWALLAWLVGNMIFNSYRESFAEAL